MTKCEIVLKHSGPLMSSELSTILVSQFGLLKNTASQVIGRDKSILRIRGFYSSSQSFCYLEQHRDQIDFYDKLVSSFFNFGKKYWYSLNALKMSGGIVSQRYLECYTNYPVVPLKSHIPFKDVMQKFVEQGIFIFDNDRYLLSPKYGKSFTNYVHYATIEAIKDAVLDNFKSLTQNTGLISFKSGELFREYGKFRFGFKGVSYISGLMDGNRNGFVIADILLGHPIFVDDVKFFVDKIETIKKFEKSSRLIAFLIVDDLHPDALKLLKSKGIVIGFVKELFGQRYAETLIELVAILNNAGASLKKSPEKYLDLINQLQTYNKGLANNIKGTLFEFVIGHIHSLKCNSLNLGYETIDDKGQKHEIDVVSIYDNKIIFSECKATKSKIDLDTIEKWDSTTNTAFYKWTKAIEVYREKDIYFEYWSVSGFTDEALLRLQYIQNTSKRYKILFYDGQALKLKAIAMKNKKLKDVVNNFFLKLDV